MFLLHMACGVSALHSPDEVEQEICHCLLIREML